MEGKRSGGGKKRKKRRNGEIIYLQGRHVTVSYWGEPHTSLAGLHCRSVFTYVLAAIYHKLEMSAFKYFMKIDLVHEGML